MTAGEMLIEMRKAIARMERLGPPPPRELRIHPADLRDLDRLMAPITGSGHLVAVGGLHGYCMDGLPVVADPQAPRLPRK
jgi:hypothetical protein